MTLETLIEQQAATVEALTKRINGLNAMIEQGTQERNQLIADTLRATGKLDGLQAALELQKNEAKPGETS